MDDHGRVRRQVRGRGSPDENNKQVTVDPAVYGPPRASLKQRKEKRNRRWKERERGEGGEGDDGQIRNRGLRLSRS